MTAQLSGTGLENTALANTSKEAAVRRALLDVYDPCSNSWARPMSVVDLGLVRSVAVDRTGHAAIVIAPTTLLCMAISVIIQAIQLKVADVPGITKVDVSVDVTADWSEDLMTEKGRRILGEHRSADRARPPVVLMPGFGVPAQGGASCP